MHRIATILARSGSKGLPHKNILELGGEPLLSRTVRQARESSLFDCTVVSSDREEYLEIAANAGAQKLVLRPSQFSGDSVTKLPGIRHAVEQAEQEFKVNYETIVDLAVTSPLRALSDIRDAVALLETTNAGIVLSAQHATDSPYFNLIEKSENGAWALSKTVTRPVNARQSSPPVFALNGAVYSWSRAELFKDNDRVVRSGIELFLMPRERSVDIDDEFDFKIAEFLFHKSLERD
ncbi:acylneuraminate cytidylyltransferase family protein [Luminiphilus sp.]|nr:acylneuraminate cytidylyltransferase family protein [Luminiphilus sp.]